MRIIFDQSTKDSDSLAVAKWLMGRSIRFGLITGELGGSQYYHEMRIDTNTPEQLCVTMNESPELMGVKMAIPKQRV